MRIRVEYRGRVQGVGFRATVRSLAEGLPVTGWVRNEPEGSVLMEAQGEAGEVGKLEKAVAAAMVGYIRSADRLVIPDQGDERGFQIRR